MEDDNKPNSKNDLELKFLAVSLKRYYVISLAVLIIAIILLTLYYWTRDFPPSGFFHILDYLSYFSSIVIAVATIAFFIRSFVNYLNKSTYNDQSDIKYFQNEMTNVELRMAAVNVALASGQQKAVQTVVEELSKTERNFILKKDETTADLEKFKAENTSTKDILQNLAGIWKAKS